MWVLPRVLAATLRASPVLPPPSVLPTPSVPPYSPLPTTLSTRLLCAPPTAPLLSLSISVFPHRGAVECRTSAALAASDFAPRTLTQACACASMCVCRALEACVCMTVMRVCLCVSLCVCVYVSAELRFAIQDELDLSTSCVCASLISAFSFSVPLSNPTLHESRLP